MSNQNNKSKNDLGLFAGNNPSKEKDRYNPKHDNSGIKGKKNTQGYPGKREQGDAGTDNKRNTRSNIGWLFYKDYYYGIDFQPGQSKDAFKDDFEKKNKAITSRKLSQYRDEVEILKLDFQTIRSFELTTEYPGLATGLGSPHESHNEGEFKLGFHFDYTTGLPIIPGSSVKGALRSAFKKTTGAEDETGYQYVQWVLQEIAKEQGNLVEHLTIEQVKALEKEIFDGEGLSPYRRDIFFDAVIVSSENKDTTFLADDFITPHPDEFKAPIPMQFLKVLPRVLFRFRFRLNNGLISAEDKKNLFEKILLDLGIGAKTNVGYGKFQSTQI